MTATWVLLFLSVVNPSPYAAPGDLGWRPASTPLYFLNRDFCEAAKRDLLAEKPINGSYEPILLKCEPIGFNHEDTKPKG